MITMDMNKSVLAARNLETLDSGVSDSAGFRDSDNASASQSQREFGRHSSKDLEYKEIWKCGKATEA